MTSRIPSAASLVLLGGTALLSMLSCSSDTTYSPATYDYAYAVALADVNSDGRLDPVIAAATFGHGPPHPGFLTLRAQNAAPAGSLLDPTRMAAGADPYALAVGDLNRDGQPDLVLANTQTVPGPLLANTITILLSNPGLGPAKFLPAQTLALGARDPLDVAIGDLNSDGLPDIGVAARGGNSLLLFFQAPGPTVSFAPPSPDNVVLSAEPTALAIGDLNGDGLPDLAVTIQSDKVSVVLQNSNPGPALFAVPIDYPVGPYPVAVRIADLDGDTFPDLAVANRGSAFGGLSILCQGPSHQGVLLAAASYDTGDHEPSSLAIGDLNGDGRRDVVVTNAGSPGSPGSLAIFLQSQAPSPLGTLLQPTLYWGYYGPASVAIGDLNGDGRPDLLLADGDPAVRFQDPAPAPAGTFQRPVWLRY